ncbi:hypothetical protein EVA_16226 [gut metagenome]|uniref:Uncharacterized protein n=1 Tax=gut metagenome TaxID=749906 RepID=J9FL93_9ZZZZ
MTDKVEVIHISHILICFHQFKVNATLQKHFFDFLFLFFLRPLANEVIQGCIFTTNILFRVIDNAFLAEQFAICIINRNRFMYNFYLATITTNNRLYSRRIRRYRRGNWVITIRRRCMTTWSESRINHNWAIPIRICKQSADITKVHNHKCVLPSFSRSLVPRPIICLNSVIEPIISSKTISFVILQSAPVDSSLDVVAITG